MEVPKKKTYRRKKNANNFHILISRIWYFYIIIRYGFPHKTKKKNRYEMGCCRPIKLLKWDQTKNEI